MNNLKQTPSKLVRKNGVYWIPTSLLMSRVPNPFTEAIWSSCTLPLCRENIRAFLGADQLEHSQHSPLRDFSIDWHERRVAFLVKRIQEELARKPWPTIALDLMPLELELPIPSLNYWPSETMPDGFHRLSAALYLDLPGVWCMPAGSVFEVVEWVRSHTDPKYIAQFERQFFKLHADMDKETGLCC